MAGRDPFATLLIQNEASDFNYQATTEPTTQYRGENSAEIHILSDTEDGFSDNPGSSTPGKIADVQERQIRAGDGPESLGGESPVRIEEPLGCQVCHDVSAKQPITLKFGVFMCSPCGIFYTKLRVYGGGRVDCVNGSNTCEITAETRGKCSPCRYWKADKLVSATGFYKPTPNSAHEIGISDEDEEVPLKRARRPTDHYQSHEETAGPAAPEAKDKTVAYSSICEICHDPGQMFRFGVNVCNTCRLFYQSWKSYLSRNVKSLQPCVSGDESCKDKTGYEIRKCMYCRFMKYYELSLEAGHARIPHITVIETTKATSQSPDSLHTVADQVPEKASKQCQICSSTKRSCPNKPYCKVCYNWFHVCAKNGYEGVKQWTCQGTVDEWCVLSMEDIARHRNYCRRCRFLKCLMLGLRVQRDRNLEELLDSTDYSLDEIANKNSMNKNTGKGQGVEKKCVVCETKPVRQNRMCSACGSFVYRAKRDNFLIAREYVCDQDESNINMIICPVYSDDRYDRCKKCRFNKAVLVNIVQEHTLPWFGEQHSPPRLATPLLEHPNDQQARDADKHVKIRKPSKSVQPSTDEPKLTKQDIKNVFEVYQIYFSNKCPTREEKLIIANEFNLKYKWVTFLFRKFCESK